MSDDRDMYLLMGRIEGKLDSALQRLAIHEERTERLEVRVSSLEKWKFYVLGITACIATVISLFDKLKPVLFGGP